MQVRADMLQDYRSMAYYDGLKNTDQKQFSEFGSQDQQQNAAQQTRAVEKSEKTNPNVAQLAAEMTGIGQQIDIQV